MSSQPLSSAIIQSALVDPKTGKLTPAGLQWVQTVGRITNSAFTQAGALQGPIASTSVFLVKGVTLAAILANLDPTGIMTSLGIDFSRVYTNQAVKYIADSSPAFPLAGGAAAYAALIGSAPALGNVLEYNGTSWEPVAPSAAVGSLNGLTGAVTLVAGSGITLNLNTPAAGDIQIVNSSAGTAYLKGSVVVACGGAMSGTFRGTAALAGAGIAMAAVASCPSLISLCTTNPVNWACDVLSAGNVEVQVTVPNIGVGWGNLTFEVVVFP